MDQRTLNMQDRRERIVDAAERLIMRDSLSAFTMRSLADEVGLSVKTLYNLCSDKDAIAAEVEDRAFCTLEAELTALPQDPDPIAQVIKIMTEAAEKAIERKAILHPVIRGDQEMSVRQQPRPLGFMNLGMRLVEAELIRASDQALLSKTLKPALLSRQITVAWFGVALLWAKGAVADAEFVCRVQHIGYCNLLAHADGRVSDVLRRAINDVETALAQS